MKKLILYLFFSNLAFVSFAQGSFDYVATASGTDTYTATILVPTFPSSYTGVEMRITFTNGNTGASTINITRSTGAVGAAAIRKWDGDSFEPLVSGDIPAGEQVTLRYTGSYFIMESFGKAASGGGGVTPVTGSGLTWNGTDRYNLGGALTTTAAITTGSNTFSVGNGSQSFSFVGSSGALQYQSTGVLLSISQASGLSVTGPIRLVNLAGTGDRMVMADADGDLSTVLDPRKLPSQDKTTSFVSAIAEAGVYHYNITPSGATTITFPDLTGQEGLQWAFWKNADADLVQFDFDGETANGATVLPDTSWVYVNWSDGRFKVAGTNPATGGGGGGTWGSITGTLSDQTDLQSALDAKATTAGNLSQFAATTSAQLRGVMSDEVGTGAAYFVGGALGTPASGTATNLTGTASGLTAGNVTTNANLTGHVTSTGNAAVLGSFTSANLSGALTNETGTGVAVFSDGPTFTGTPAAPTATLGTNTTQLATTSFVANALFSQLSNPQTGNYTLQASDVGKEIPITSASLVTITLPAGVFADGNVIGPLYQTSTGGFTFTTSGGATVVYESLAATTTDKLRPVSVKHVTGNLYYVFNGLPPATGGSMSRVNGTNVTMTISGDAADALPPGKAVTYTMGWTGTLAVPLGGTGLSSSANGDVVIGTGSNTMGVVNALATSRTAYWHLKAGTATASTAPLKFTSGTNLTTAENGAVEYDGTNFFVSSSSTRYTVAKILSNSSTIDFGSVSAGGEVTNTITVTGAADGDEVILGHTNATSSAGLFFVARVSATNTVTVTAYNITGSPIDPASGTFKVSVIKR